MEERGTGGDFDARGRPPCSRRKREILRRALLNPTKVMAQTARRFPWRAAKMLGRLGIEQFGAGWTKDTPPRLDLIQGFSRR